MPSKGRFFYPRAPLAANLLIGLVGLALLALAIAAGQGWTDRHFLPTFAWTRSFQIGVVQVMRALLVLLALFLILFVRPRVAGAVAAGRGKRLLVSTLSVSLAVGAAFAVTETVLHSRTWHATQERWSGKVPVRKRDALTGWTFEPNRHGRAPVDGRTIDYATDRFGYRVRAAGEQTDPARPTIVFAGESIIFGYGLAWDESIPAQVRAMTGLATADLSVNAYANDQIYLRLRTELPRFRRPLAVVIPFVPMLFDRNLDRDRPHLDTALRWHPGQPPSLRLVELARRILRYRGTQAVDEGVATTQAVLKAAIALARSRGAIPLIVIPSFQPEEPAERAVRMRVLDAAHIPYLLVPLDPGWRLVSDRHPDARGARAIAAAISRALLAELGRNPR